MTMQICAYCGVEWVDGKRWAGEHKPLCANDQPTLRLTVYANAKGTVVYYPPDDVGGVIKYVRGRASTWSVTNDPAEKPPIKYG